MKGAISNKSSEHLLIVKGKYLQGRIHRIQFNLLPISKGRTERNLVEALIYEKGTGSFEWRAQLTGEIEIGHVHRLTAATPEEVEVGGKKAEYCIIA